MISTAMRGTGIFRFLLTVSYCSAAPDGVIANRAPSLLTYDQIQQLYHSDQPSPLLRDRLHQLLSTPFVSNRASANGALPIKPWQPGLGTCLIVAEWNIERGLEFEAIKLALSDPEGFSALLTKRIPPTEELDKSYGPFGAYKIDWVFVKPYHLTAPQDRSQSYRFAPHFGRTMRRLNQALPGHISDHNPITVILPLHDPPG